jgi:hypothetical protein
LKLVFNEAERGRTPLVSANDKLFLQSKHRLIDFELMREGVAFVVICQ